MSPREIQAVWDARNDMFCPECGKETTEHRKGWALCSLHGWIKPNKKEVVR